jgi:DNA-binding MarR family transcriptional regulator
MNSRIDAIAQGFVQLLPMIYNTLSNETGEKPPAKQEDLTHLHSHILETLFQASESLSITELARRIDISKQQMTPIIQKLEEGGYIIKVRDSSDKRAFNIILSDKGKNLVTTKWEALYHIFCKRLELINAEEQIDLEYAIHKVITILTKLNSTDVRGKK